MANFISINNKWYSLPNDPTKAATAASNCKNNLTFGPRLSNANIYTQIQNADSTWRAWEWKHDGKEYDH